MTPARWIVTATLSIAPACDADAPSDAGGTSGGETSSSTTDSSTTEAASSTSEASTGTSSGPTGETTSASEDSSTTDEAECDAFEPGDAFEIAADASSTRIHPHAAGDGAGAWFTFVAPEPAGSLFDVMLMHLRCPQDVDVAPMLVNTAPGNDIDASVAVSEERVMVVWNTDDGSGGSSNLQINARTYDLAGAPQDETQQRITTAFEGTPIPENHTFGVVTAASGGFAVAGLRAHPQSPAFVAFVQDLDGDGALLGEAWGAPIEAGVSHLLASSSGPWLAYGRGDADDQVWITDGTEAVAAFAGGPAQGGHVLARPEAPQAPLVAAALASGGGFDLGIAVGTGAPLVLGEGGALEHSPTLALGPGGALAVVFHRNVAGLNNAVVFQRLAIEGDAVVALGDALELDTMSPPYPPSLTWTPGGWLVTWSRGQSPDFTTWGQVLAPR